MPSARTVVSPEAWTLSPSGSTRRADYVRALYASLLSLGVAFAVASGADRHPEPLVRWVGFLLASVILAAGLWHAAAATMRRLADAGRSRWLGFLGLIPVFNLLVFVWAGMLPEGEDAGVGNHSVPASKEGINCSARDFLIKDDASRTIGAEPIDEVEGLWLKLKFEAAGEPPSVQVQLRLRYRAKLEKLVAQGRCDRARAAQLVRRMMTDPLK